MENDKNQNIIHALKYRILNPLYDPITRISCRETAFKRYMVRQFEPAIGSVLLDLACGTGTYALMLASAYPDARVVGIDADESILRIAGKKSDRRGMKIEFIKGFAQSIPLADASVDTVYASLLFHHLRSGTKKDALADIRRVLKPGGRICIADWGKPLRTMEKIGFAMVRLFDGYESTEDTAKGKISALMQEANFYDITLHKRFTTMFGALCIWSGIK